MSGREPTASAPVDGREPTASAPAVVSFDDVTCRYGDLVAVDTVALQLPAGVLLGLVGPSGSGKTTIVRTMRGAVSPAAGSVRVFGHDPRRMPQRDRRRLGYMPQHFSLYPELTAEENVDFVASLFGLLFPRRRRRTREVLQTVDLWPVRGRRAENLSGGMQRRVQLAATLVHEPDLLLLDEPTAGLDPLLRARVWEEVRRLRDEGRTILVTTQYVAEAEECDVVALIVEGRLAALGTPDELRARAAGGEVLVVETSRPLTDSDLRDMPGIRAARPAGPRRMRLTVESASHALPQLVEWLSEHGVDVAQASEERPTFDEVFAALVRRADGTADGADGGAAAADASADGAVDGADTVDGGAARADASADGADGIHTNGTATAGSQRAGTPRQANDQMSSENPADHASPREDGAGSDRVPTGGKRPS